MKLDTNQRFSLALLVLTVCLLVSCKQFSPNKNDVKLREVEKLYATLPIHQGFRETWSGSVSKSMLASVGKHYTSDASYADVKDFYVAKLIPQGWQLTKEVPLKEWSEDRGGRQLTFTKEEYSVVIEYSGDKAVNPDWNYGIDVGWHSNKAW